MAKKAEKSAETRNRMIEAGRAVFERDGYASAQLSEIVERAEVTTGALYHHFGGKKGLFAAVAEELERRILQEVAQRTEQGADAWGRFEAGVVGALAICSRPDIQRIVFREAPTVIGQAEWREVEMRYAFGVMREEIAKLAAAGEIRAEDPELTAQILLGAVIEAAHGAALAEDGAAALTRAQDTVLRFVRALRAAG